MVIELITGHVFAKGSVTSVAPLRYEFNNRGQLGRLYFTVIGTGFTTTIYPYEALEQDASVLMSKLSGGFIRPGDFEEANWFFSFYQDYKQNWSSISHLNVEQERFKKFWDKYFLATPKSAFAQYILEDSVSKLLGEVTTTHPTDTQLLDFLDKRVERVVEGQTLTDPHGDHVANRWVVEQQSSNLRDAIHQLMKGHEFSKDPS